jgi:peptidyl-prolyl cis-trans isomerase SurA
LVQARKHRTGVSCLGLVCMLALLAGCSGCGQASSSQDVMAKVNGYKILRSEVDKSYNVQIAGSPQKPTPAEEEALRLNILEQIIRVQLHLQQAEKLGVVATDDEVDSKFNQMKAPYTQEEFQKKLKDQGLTEADAKQEIRRNLTIEKLLNKEIASKVTISDNDIQNYYNQHKAEFNLIEPRYFMASISVAIRPPGQPPGDKGQTDAQARQKIQMIFNRLESGEDFGTVAAQWSEDTDTAHNGGEMGPVPESQLKRTDAATRDAVQKLKPGQYSNIIPVVNPETHQLVGYRIVKLIGKEAAGQRDLNDPAVQQWIRNQLRTQREQVLRAAYDEVLRDKAEVHNYFAENILKSTAAQK